MLLYGLGAIAVIAFTFFYLFFYRNWRRQRHLEQPFPDRWRSVLQSMVPLYRRLPASLARQLEQHIQLFLAEKDFYGCDGFDVTERVRVAIAGHACLLIMARRYSDYDEVQSILVYPDAYHVRSVASDGLVVSERSQIRAGEASSRGQVLLAWAECENAIREPDEAHNVILHEFAHQLDYLDGTADGAPPLSGEQARHWQSTMTRAYENLRHSLHHRHPWLDPYGATEPAEFFAVLTEAFFQQPSHLRTEQPGVYQALCDFYRVDPQSFHG